MKTPFTPHLWPGDARTVENWVRAQVALAAQHGIRGLDRLRVSAQVQGDDLTDLTIDASRVRLSVQPSLDNESVSSPDDTAAEEVPPRTPVRTGMAHHARLTTKGMKVNGYPVTVDGHARSVPITWITLDAATQPEHPETAYLLGGGEHLAGMTAHVSLSMQTSHLGPLATTIIRPAMAESGVHVRRITVDVLTPGAEQVQVTATVAARWKMIGVRLRAFVGLTVTPDGVVTVQSVRISSRNILAALALRVARGELRKVEGKVVDLNDSAASAQAGVRMHDLRVTASDDLTVSLRIA